MGNRDGFEREFTDLCGSLSVAPDYDGQLLTSDVVQSRVAEVIGVSVGYTAPKTREPERLGIEKFFDDWTLSVHLKADVSPMAKRGEVGDMYYQPIRESGHRGRTQRVRTRDSSGCERAQSESPDHTDFVAMD